MRTYPADIDVTSPERFDRVQLLLRLGVAIVLGALGITVGWLVWMLYATLPLIAAIALSTGTLERFRDEISPRLWRVIAWLLHLSAYMLLLVDRFPTAEQRGVAATMHFTGRPTVRTALVRLVTSIPSGFMLALLWLVSGVVWFFAFAFVLVGARMPHSLLAFQRGVLRWQTRLVAYHASFVDAYPPFELDTGEGHGTTAPVTS